MAYKLTFGIDLVFCIDATGSMDHILDTVKNNALNLYKDFQERMTQKYKSPVELRVRLVAFRDYYYDGDKAMMVTDFFKLPSQAAAFEKVVRYIEAAGGGDNPEDGLEAVAYAIKSDWNRTAMKKRHVIVVWSDDGTHELGFGKTSSYYPSGMPKDFNELTMWWGSKNAPGLMDEHAKRLILFTPNKKHWTLMRDNWNNVIHYESQASNGLKEWDYDQILDTISNSI
jgi:hypothetical protein